MLTGETQVTAMNGKAFVFIVINLQPSHLLYLSQINTRHQFVTNFYKPKVDDTLTIFWCLLPMPVSGARNRHQLSGARNHDTLSRKMIPAEKKQKCVPILRILKMIML